MHLSPSKVAAFACYVTWSLFVALNTLHWTRKFLKRRNDFGFLCRRPSLVWHTELSLCVFILFRIADQTLALFLHAEPKYIHNGSVSISYWLSLVTSLGSLVSFVMTAVECSLRVWLIYYDCCLAANDPHLQWVTLITAPVIYQPQIVVTAEDIDEESLWEELTKDPKRRLTEWVKVNVPEPRKSSAYFEGSEWSHWKRRGHTTLWGLRRESSIDPSFSVHAIINEEQASLGDWFYREKPRWGNPVWLKKQMKVMVPGMITLSVIIQTFAMFIYMRDLSMVLLSLMFASFLAGVAYYYPANKDSVEMVTEFSLGLITGSLAVIYIVMSVVVSTVLREGYQRGRINSGFHFWNSLIHNSSLLLVCLSFMLVQTKWVCLTFANGDHQSSSFINHTHHHRKISSSMNNNNNDDDDDELDLEYSLMSTSLVLNPSDNLDIRPVSLARTLCCIERLYRMLPDVIKENTWMNFGCLYKTELKWSNSYSGSSMTSVIRQISGLPSGFSEDDRDGSGIPSKFIEEFKLGNLKEVNIRDILADNSAAILFVMHLFSELSYSSLLCLLELQQFSDSLRREEDVPLVDPDEYFLTPTVSSIPVNRLTYSTQSSILSNENHIKFAPSMSKVQSSIVWNRHMTKEQRFVVICKKYFSDESEMPVVISNRHRRQLMDICDYLLSGEIKSLVASKGDLSRIKQSLVVDGRVFDAVKRELLMFLKEPLDRFKSSPAYKSLSLRSDRLRL